MPFERAQRQNLYFTIQQLSSQINLFFDKKKSFFYLIQQSENNVRENAPTDDCLRRKKTTWIIKILTSEQDDKSFEATYQEGGDAYRSYFRALWDLFVRK